MWFIAILLAIFSLSSSSNLLASAVDKKYEMIGEPNNPMCFASKPTAVLTNIRSLLECSSKCSHYVSPTDGNFTCEAFNYISNNASHPAKYCQLFHFINKTTTNLSITLSKSCNIPFTFNGGLLYSCSNSLPGVNNPCALYMCLTANRQLSICVGDQINSEHEKYSINVSGYCRDKNDVMNNPDSFLVQNEMKFTTPDQDNDEWANGNCVLQCVHQEIGSMSVGVGVNCDSFIQHSHTPGPGFQLSEHFFNFFFTILIQILSSSNCSMNTSQCNCFS
ncbi:hypothetical protein HELRODRAFT_177976 [Helobdella robusta]|uniref:Fibrinogen C-terminal domain-containing protein n=1 Tax=Helobdella robusta TaxID=6412 RepID=T1FCK0_HELRO|nr:hypothetical protein HELRODRAFT_177976 [Helobdella robusta]ESN97544.1 hypothetical protein HELRODRAFT_177976 [Helobdella robusta]